MDVLIESTRTEPDVPVNNQRLIRLDPQFSKNSALLKNGSNWLVSGYLPYMGKHVALKGVPGRPFSKSKFGVIIPVVYDNYENA